MRFPALAALLLLAAPAVAQLPDAAGWIRRCMEDSANQAAAPLVRMTYCTCLVSQANDAGAATIEALEQILPDARRQCREIAGWR
ncbi:hypothetical protein KTR66_14485 [Roseococcus sp. SDR]|uniref:hypothetical protein n=1 Tax=Roseococcus sp. SDR TaxID=2835532 RepID=UPI001BCED5FA|nr:hypothetical protein [Roseococcus sp. SDR]MBS7791208.1 hypothetical protein [Roseococcus sp. SDR]MBV1846522.1 hypothetical protein [Roseococcus sp. SDR]